MNTKTRGVMLAAAALTMTAACLDEARSATEPLLAPQDRREGQRTKTMWIRGMWDNTEAPPSADPPKGCALQIPTTQEGRATHVGPFTGHGVTCANPVGPPTETPPHWFHDPAPPYLVAEFTNEMVWTAADGSELWLQPNEGVFVQSVANGAASVRGVLRVTGGTGRFAGARGELRARGGRDPGEAGDRVHFRGRIRTPVGRIDHD